MFKKFRMTVSLLLIFVMCTGLMPAQPAFAEDEAAAAAGETELRAMDVLRLLNIVPDDYYDYNVSLDTGVTRADFASAAAKLINMGDENNSAVYYYDVPQSHWAHDAISTLTDMGVLNGQENKLFRPDMLIEKNEAYKMLITILGYREMAEYSGGYPEGYLKIAQRIKLTQGVSDSTTVTRGDMFVLLYNALTAEMSEAVVYSGKQKTYRTSEDRTLLSVYWDIYKGRGIVSGVNCMTLEGGTLKAGEVKIDDTVYTSDVSMTEYLGHEVEFFYHQSGTNEKKVMWASETSGNLVLDINVNYDASFDRTSYVLSYYADGGSRRTVTLNRGVTVVYNGAVASTDISEIFSLPKYTARLISIGGAYKTAIVWAYDNLVIDNIDSAAKTVYDKIESTRKISLDENNYEYMALYMSGGNQVSFDSLQPGYVLSCYLSQDGKYLTVRISTEKISGVVDSVTDDDDGYILTINAVSYFMPKSVYNDPKAGDSVTLYTDAAGDIAAYTRELGNAAYIPAFVTKGVVARTLFGRYLQLNVVKNDGSVSVMRSADKLTVDGAVYSGNKTGDAYSVFLRDEQFEPQFVMLKTNSDGDIIMIDTVRHGEEEDITSTLSVSVPFQENARYKSNGSLGMKSVFDNNTIIFMVPSREKISEAKDTSFYVVNRSKLTNNDLVNVETYKITDRIGYEQFAVIWGYEMGYTSALPVLVQSVSTVLDENNCPIPALDGYQGGNEVSIPASSDVSFDGIEPGMVIRANVNPSTSLLEGYEILFDYRNMEAYPPLANADAPYRTAGGYVNDLVDTVISIGYTDPAAVDQVMYTTNIPVLVYDTGAKSNNITVGAINEARTYRNAGADCSKVLMASRNGTPVLYILYN